MVVAQRNYIVSNSALILWDYDPIGEPTVQNFLGSIISRKQYLFKLNPAGSGCREWV